MKLNRNYVYIWYYKTEKGYKAESFSYRFRTLQELKNFFNKTSAFPVKFIKREKGV